MRTYLLSGLCVAASIVYCGGDGRAHGGQYRGPLDTVPPSPGGRGTGPSGPTTGGPSAPGSPSPSGPVTPGSTGPGTGGPSGPAGARAGQTGGRGIEVVDDFTRWEAWWEHNKDPYLRLRDAVHEGGPETGSPEFYLGPTRRPEEARDTLRPTDQQIRDEILPALKKAIDATENRDIASSCMVAMAKVGVDHPDWKLVDVFAARLSRHDQEVRETAALSIGIAAIAGERELQLLHGLALDDAVGQKACARDHVDDRTRAFALYGLGLVAHQTSRPETKERVLATASKLLADDRRSDRNVKVAAIHAIGLLNLDPTSDAQQALLANALQQLEAYYRLPLGAGEQLIQAHCPTAIAKLLGRSHPGAGRWKQVFAAGLQAKGDARRSNDLSRSCALALGQLCLPYDDDASPDAAHSKLLLDVYHDHKDQQTRYFAVLALGQIGGAQNRSALLREFDKGSKTQEKPWCALALGVYAFHRFEAQRAAEGSADPDRLIATTLLTGLTENREPGVQSALAIALGLARAADAAPRMRAMMLENVPKEQLAGYLCIGLSLLGDRGSIEEIRAVVDRSVRRVDLLKQAAVALGKLGDKQAALLLQQKLREQGTNLAALSAIASALGFIGDRRSIAPLKAMLFDDQLGELSRAFAAVALGGIADKEPLPWNSKIGAHANYRAAVETLTNGQTGILDIL